MSQLTVLRNQATQEGGRADAALQAAPPNDPSSWPAAAKKIAAEARLMDATWTKIDRLTAPDELMTIDAAYSLEIRGDVELWMGVAAALRAGQPGAVNSELGAFARIHNPLLVEIHKGFAAYAKKHHVKLPAWLRVLGGHG